MRYGILCTVYRTHPPLVRTPIGIDIMDFAKLTSHID